MCMLCAAENKMCSNLSGETLPVGGNNDSAINERDVRCKQRTQDLVREFRNLPHISGRSSISKSPETIVLSCVIINFLTHSAPNSLRTQAPCNYTSNTRH